MLHHHERYDGQGYPAGLEAQDIPLAARAVAVLEAYSAMTHERPHRAPRSPEEACEELIEHAGTQFDPECVELLVERVRLRPAPPSDQPLEGLLESLPLDRLDGDDRALDAVPAATLDGFTLLGDHRALLRAIRDAASEATAERRFAVVLLQLQDLPRINDQLGYLAGDRVIEVAARQAATAATRLGRRPTGRAAVASRCTFRSARTRTSATRSKTSAPSSWPARLSRSSRRHGSPETAARTSSPGTARAQAHADLITLAGRMTRASRAPGRHTWGCRATRLRCRRVLAFGLGAAPAWRHSRLPTA